jgi:hypothetical protein
LLLVGVIWCVASVFSGCGNSELVCLSQEHFLEKEPDRLTTSVPLRACVLVGRAPGPPGLGHMRCKPAAVGGRLPDPPRCHSAPRRKPVLQTPNASCRDVALVPAALTPKPPLAS